MCSLTSYAHSLSITARTGVQLIPKITLARACCYKLIVCLRAERKCLTNERAITLFAPISVQKSVIVPDWSVRVQYVENRIFAVVQSLQGLVIAYDDDDVLLLLLLLIGRELRSSLEN